MHIGLVSLYSFRPHVEHLFYVSTLLKQLGHKVFFLTCDGALDNCYARTLKGTSKAIECPACIAGGIRSYPVSSITSIKRKTDGQLLESQKRALSFSSACTLLRTETQDDVNTDGYEQLNRSFHSSVDMTFANAMNWIDSNCLDGVICFNGRIDATKAVIYACERKAVPFMTLERPWFSDGLQLNPRGDCLSLRDVIRLNEKYSEAPLTDRQARYAALLIASRFLGTNQKEWRAYNLKAQTITWPSPSIAGIKVLILPSSRNEFQGHPEWESSWSSYVDGFAAVLSALQVPMQNVVLRCHPNWGEKIGVADGQKSERLYANWAREKGIHCIGSKDTASTFDLIQECDILVVNGSSAALEAGAYGKKIVCLGHSTYEEAGVAIHIEGMHELNKLKLLDIHDSIRTIRYTLRYVYTMTKRFAQYVDYVEALSPTRYRYHAGADPNKVIKALMSGELEADDGEVATDDKDENLIVRMISDRRWSELSKQSKDVDKSGELLDIGRRRGLRWLDNLREKLPRGDLWRGK